MHGGRPIEPHISTLPVCLLNTTGLIHDTNAGLVCAGQNAD